MPRRYLVFSLFLAGYFTSVFSRSANAAIASDLQQTFQLSPADLGLMTSLFLLAVAVMQLPFGMALDRYGARSSTAVTMIFAVVGAYIFSIAENNAMLMLGRTLIGLGISGILMGAFVALGQYFPAERFSSAVGVLVSLGALGSIFASKPLVLLNDWLGWRAIFLYLALMIALVALGIMLFVRRGPLEPSTPAENNDAKLLDIFRNAAFWRIGILDFAMAGGFFAFQGLWLAPYLQEGLGLSEVALGNILTLLNVGVVVGYLLSGWLCDRFPIRWVMAICAIIMLGNSLYLALVPATALQNMAWLRNANIISYGFMGSASIQLITQARALFPSHMAGRASTACNLLGFGGSALMQWFLGIFVGFFAVQGIIPAYAYRAMFLVVAIVLLIGLVAYLPLLRRQPQVLQK